jgi:hypothetical protein
VKLGRIIREIDVRPLETPIPQPVRLPEWETTPAPETAPEPAPEREPERETVPA